MTPSSPIPNQTHKVLSLTGTKKKRVVISSYTTKPKPASTPTPAVLHQDEEDSSRVPPPPTEVIHYAKTVDRSRPWRNLGDGALEYIPLARLDGQSGSSMGKSRRHRGGGQPEGKEN